MIFWLFSLFVFVLNSKEQTIEVNQLYQGTCGDGVSLKFLSPQTNASLPPLFSVTLRITGLPSGANAKRTSETFLSNNIAMDSLPGTAILSLLMIDHAPNGDNRNYRILSTNVDGIAQELTCLASAHFIIFYISGQANTNYSLIIERKDVELKLDQQFAFNGTKEDAGSIIWFIYDQIATDIDIPVHINVWGTKNDSTLHVVHANCVNSSSRYNSAHLSFDSYGGIVLNQVSKPYLATGRWFIGIQPSMSFPDQQYSVLVQRGLSTANYVFPMVFPPVIMVVIFLVVLGPTIFGMKYFSVTGGLAKLFELEDSRMDYLSLTLTFAVAFLVPGFQVIFGELSKMSQTGNYDICYYNGKCQHPSGRFYELGVPALNNVYSNIGYVVAGSVFLIYMFFYRLFSRSFFLAGTPKDAGILYAFGVSVICEGFASGLYHLCPSGMIFQFDSAMMFVIMVLAQAELFRRTCYPPSASAIFFSCAVLILANYLGSSADYAPLEVRQASVATMAWALWFLITVVFVFYVGPLLFMGPQQTFVAFWRTLATQFREVFGAMSKRKLLAWFLVYMVNATVPLLYYFNLIGGFGDGILMCLIFTQGASVFVYEFNVVLHFWKVIPLGFKLMKVFLILLLVVLWGLALYFFAHQGYDVSVSPAQSRDRNVYCIGPSQFYDNHDLWHYLGACALLGQGIYLFHLDLNVQHEDTSIVIGEFLYHHQQAHADAPYTESLLGAGDKSPLFPSCAPNYNALNDVLDEEAFYGRLYNKDEGDD